MTALALRGKGIHHLKVMTNVAPEFLKETLHRPWMRLKIFLDEGPLARTPECYKKFYYDWQVKTPSPVHYIPEPGNWKILKDGQIGMVQNRPLPLVYPNELHQGLWGGEAVVKGFEKRKPRRRRVAYYWVPELRSTVLYSEILEKYLNFVVTERALRLIDDHYGLDAYIMKTEPADLMSELALKLKRDMFYAIVNKSFYPNDEARQEEVYKKYKDYIIPVDEIEWFGLTLAEAYRKQSKFEDKENFVGAYKHIFRQEFIQHFKENPDVLDSETDKQKGILQRLKLFGKK